MLNLVLLLLNLLLLLLLLNLLAARLSAVLRHRGLQVLVPRQRKHVDAVLLAVRQAAPDEALKKKTTQVTSQTLT